MQTYRAILELEGEDHLGAVDLLVNHLGGDPALGGVGLPGPRPDIVRLRHVAWMGAAAAAAAEAARPGRLGALVVGPRAGSSFVALLGGYFPWDSRPKERGQANKDYCDEAAGGGTARRVLRANRALIRGAGGRPRRARCRRKEGVESGRWPQVNSGGGSGQAPLRETFV